MRKIGFGGGCHWCTEAIFQALSGVSLVKQGWVASSKPYDTFSEAVIVHFDEPITLDVLIEIHLLTHSSIKAHSVHDKYRSAVYYFDSNDKYIAESVIDKLERENATKYITLVQPFANFKLNSERFLNYYQKGKQKPFCQSYITPKLTAIRSKFARHVRSDF